MSNSIGETMVKRNTVLYAFLATITLSLSCIILKTSSVAPQELASWQKVKSITVVIKRDTSLVDIDMKNVVYKNDSIAGLAADNTRCSVAISDIMAVKIYKTKVNGFLLSVYTGAAVVAVLMLVGEATAPSPPPSSSCPFLYSFDGSSWVFDAEPYGGAICRGLKRTDWCVLEHLKEAQGCYTLLMTNELEETQFTDELKLVVIDHDVDVAITPDASGGMHTIANPMPPRSARKGDGMDIMPLFAAKDGQSWRSTLFDENPAGNPDLRDSLYFEFEKPKSAQSVKLIVNASTTPFGAAMGRRFLTMHGGRVTKWYNEVDRGGVALDRVIKWYRDEELYMLKLWVQTPHGWEERATILGSGPFVTKDRVYAIDVRDIPGDALHIKLCPPAGFWSFDFLAADYSENRPIVVHEIGIAEGRDNTGKDVREYLNAIDDTCLVSETASSVKLRFDPPPAVPGTARTVVLKADGWYRMLLDAKGLPRLDLLARMKEPGYSIKYAAREYRRLRLHETSK
jgi:hypothetical protein